MQVLKVNKGGTAHWVLLDDDMHLIDPVCEFLEFQRKIDRADNTLRAYAVDLKIYWEFLMKSSYRYDQVSILTIADFVDYLRSGAGDEASLYVTSSRTNRSINRIMSSVHRFYRYEQLNGACPDPVFFETVPETEQMYQSLLAHTKTGSQTKKSIFKLKESTKTARIVTKDEMNRFLRALERQRDRLLFALLYETGARIQEALDLEVSMLPQPDERKAVGVFRQIRSKGKRRDLYAPMPLIRALNDFVYGKNGADADRQFLFVAEKTNYAGRQLTYHAAYDIMRRTQQRLGMEFCFHDLRHTFCTGLIESGVDVGIVRQVMGHANLYTTKRYVHLSDEYLMESMNRYWSDRERGDRYEAS
ncbi:MAG: tyrosine-type recombinase/integrase [Eubacterium sp.]|nr:tyrosine-type recombinase/integrase [Eubacterium sp.]